MSVVPPWSLLIAVALGALAGAMSADTAVIGGVALPGIFDFAGTLFVNALKMLILPLLMSSIIVGIAGVGAGRNLGRLGLRALICYFATTLGATVMGLGLVSILRPGAVSGQARADLLGMAAASADVAEEIADKGFDSMLDVFLGVIPANVVGAAAGDDLLGIVVFSVLFGLCMSRLDHELAEPMYRFWSAVLEVMMRMTGWVMMLAPLGAFALVARAVSRTGLAAAGPVLAFGGVVVLALLLHALVTLPVALRLIGRISPFALYRAMAPALIMAFSTASSAATLPSAIDCAVRRAGVSNRVSSLVLSLGASLNMNGTALYQAAAAVFLAQAYGIDLDFGMQVTIGAMALVSSVGLPGIPSASIVAMAIIISAVGLPNEAIGILLALDRLMDMVRTAVNVTGDAACTVFVARLNGESVERLAVGSRASR
jgi:Na+/H+-dicarboxylate symporter